MPSTQKTGALSQKQRKTCKQTHQKLSLTFNTFLDTPHQTFPHGCFIVSNANNFPMWFLPHQYIKHHDNTNPHITKGQLKPKNIITSEITKKHFMFVPLTKNLQHIGVQNICHDTCIDDEFCLLIKPLTSPIKGKMALRHGLVQ